MPRLILVVPCYNEEEIIEKTAGVMAEKLRRLIGEGSIAADSRILFVNDGSRDDTAKIIHSLTQSDGIFSLISLAGNCGHQNAILAGMMFAKDKADIVVTIDADLQQDIEALDDFISKYKAGCEVVYGVRNDRNTDGAMKKMTASLYYNLMHALGTKVIKNHADYRLVSAKALNALSGYSEVNLFLRGLIPTMGFTSDVVYFDVKEREAGTSKYTLAKMLTLAMDGITSFSTKPLHLIGLAGFIAVILAVIMCIVVLVDWINGKNVPGYTTLLIIMLVATGAILISLGVIGEYIAKVYMETKRRPHYIIDTVVWQEGRASDREASV
ncbi:MAG: glycosyltransferase family 2 protein [Lachnospiraceae bacterium]|nr:glycosyltransferase family 2 protein [Lachnospiraceae bacterium]